MLAFCCANTLIAYGAFGEALHYWDVSRVSAVLSTAPIVTLASMWVIERAGLGLMEPEGLNALSVVGALAAFATMYLYSKIAQRYSAATFLLVGGALAVEGDTVLVVAGTYAEDVDFAAAQFVVNLKCLDGWFGVNHDKGGRFRVRAKVDAGHSILNGCAGQTVA